MGDDEIRQVRRVARKSCIYVTDYLHAMVKSAITPTHSAHVGRR